MNRRTLLSATAGVALSLTASRSVFAAATPEATPAGTDPNKFIVPNTQGPDASVGRLFNSSQENPSGTDPLWLQAFGLAFSSVTALRSYIDPFVLSMRTFEISNPHVGVGPVEILSVRAIGDETWAREFRVSSETQPDWIVTCIEVRKEKYLQILLCCSRESSITMAPDISDQTVKRWPNQNKPHVSMGIHAGGLWDLLPTLQDVPEGMVFQWDDDRS